MNCWIAVAVFFRSALDPGATLPFMAASSSGFSLADFYEDIHEVVYSLELSSSI